MSTADYLGGLAWFVPMLAGTLGGTAILVRKRLPHLAGAPLAVSFALIATGALLAVHIVPGALGILSRPSVLVATVAWVVVALAVRPVHRPAVADIEPPRDHGVLRWAAFLGAGAVLVFLVATAFSQIAVA